MLEVINVKTLDDFMLEVEFSNGEVRFKDMKPYFNKSIFKKIEEKSVFESVKIIDGAITWILSDGYELDICPDNTYKTSTEVRYA